MTSQLLTLPPIPASPVVDSKSYCLAGRAKFTILNTETKNRFTYRISVPKEQKGPTNLIFFVAVLTGCDNDYHYEFLGMLFEGGAKFQRSFKSRITEKAPSCIAFAWFWKHLIDGNLPVQVKVYHAGHCGRCGKTLTVPASLDRANGIGPECVKILGIA